MSLRWYDVHSPHSKYGVGQIEVEGDKIKRTSPALRWALGLHFETALKDWERKGFVLILRRACNSKSFDKPAKKFRDAPSDSALYHRVSP